MTITDEQRRAALEAMNEIDYHPYSPDDGHYDAGWDIEQSADFVTKHYQTIRTLLQAPSVDTRADAETSVRSPRHRSRREEMTYPNSPGYAQNSATSRSAAEQLTGRGEIASAVLNSFYMSAVGRTVDELKTSIEAALGRDFDRTTIGARVTELKAEGMVEETPMTRTSARGRQVTVFRLTIKGRDYCLNN